MTNGVLGPRRRRVRPSALRLNLLVLMMARDHPDGPPPDASALMGPRHVGFSCRFLQSPDIENCLLGSTLSGLFSSILEPSFDLRPAIADPTFRQANTRWRAPSAELSTQCVLGVPERLGSISLSQHAIWAQPACSRRPRRGPARGASKSLATAVVCAHGLNDESLSMRMHQC
jgi:hypothetical protein